MPGGGCYSPPSGIFLNMLFATPISISGVREGGVAVAATLRASVVDDGVLSEDVCGHPGATYDQFTFFIRANDWPEVLPPQIGDIISTDDGSRYAVTRRSRLGECYALAARSRKR